MVSAYSAFWVDGTPVSALPLPNRGLEFGDGVFETLLLHHGKPLFADLHLERLALGLQALSLPHCLEVAQQHLESAAKEVGIERWPWAVLRMSVIRGPGARGYTPTENSKPQILIYVSQIDRDCGQMHFPATVGVASIRLSTQPLLAHIKHLNRLEQVLASVQAHAGGTDECVMLDQSGYPNSVIAGNLFLVREGELITPKLIDCGVVGTRRRLIIEKWGPSIGLGVRESQITLSDLMTADEVFFSNSVYTVRPIARLNDVCWVNHTVCAALFQRYLEELE